MKLGEFDPKALGLGLRHPGIILGTGPFRVHLRADAPRLAGQLQRLYPEASIRDRTIHHPVDFHLRLRRPTRIRRWIKPQVELLCDGDSPFDPFPLDHALPLFEWGYNWNIATRAHQYLMLHSAVVEKNGWAVILPALPGSGKSTLSAAMMLRGWRLLSDEFGLIRPKDPELRLHPLPRPIPLKNESIALIRDFEPGATLGPTYPKTRKGDVAHLMATLDSQVRQQETARPGWFVFVKYQAGAPTRLEPLPQGWTFLKISGNSFNYKLQGALGFRAVVELVKRCPAYSLTYSDLDDAISALDRLTAEAPAAPAAR